MTKIEINTLALLRALKLRAEIIGGAPTGLDTLDDLESRIDKPADLPVSTPTWRDVRAILRKIDCLDREDEVLGLFDPDAVWMEIDGQMVLRSAGPARRRP